VVAIRTAGTIDILSLADPANPIVTASGELGVSGEPYGLAVSPDAQRAIVVTNDGWFVIVALSQLPASSITWPAF